MHDCRGVVLRPSQKDPSSLITMSQSDLIEHLIQRIRADVRFLHSHDLLSQSARDAILVQLEAVNGNGNLNGNAAVAGLATQMDAASLHHSHQPQPSFATAPSASATSAAASLHSGGRSPIPTPAPPADTRERARALWDYAATWVMPGADLLGMACRNDPAAAS
jgi:hypothetical protein